MNKFYLPQGSECEPKVLWPIAEFSLSFVLFHAGSILKLYQCVGKMDYSNECLRHANSIQIRHNLLLKLKSSPTNSIVAKPLIFSSADGFFKRSSEDSF